MHLVGDKAAKEQMSDLKGDILQLERQNSLLHGDLFSRDNEEKDSEE